MSLETSLTALGQIVVDEKGHLPPYLKMQAGGKVTDLKTTSMCWDKLIFGFQTICYRNIAYIFNKGLS